MCPGWTIRCLHEREKGSKDHGLSRAPPLPSAQRAQTLHCISPHKAGESLESHTNGVPLLRPWEDWWGIWGSFLIINYPVMLPRFWPQSTQLRWQSDRQPKPKPTHPPLRVRLTHGAGLCHSSALSQRGLAYKQVSFKTFQLTLFLKTRPSGCCHDNHR